MSQTFGSGRLHSFATGVVAPGAEASCVAEGVASRAPVRETYAIVGTPMADTPSGRLRERTSRPLKRTNATDASIRSTPRGAT
jgi:hypothetical protein